MFSLFCLDLWIFFFFIEAATFVKKVIMSVWRGMAWHGIVIPRYTHQSHQELNQSLIIRSKTNQNQSRLSLATLLIHTREQNVSLYFWTCNDFQINWFACSAINEARCLFSRTSCANGNLTLANSSFIALFLLSRCQKVFALVTQGQRESSIMVLRSKFHSTLLGQVSPI